MKAWFSPYSFFFCFFDPSFILLYEVVVLRFPLIKILQVMPAGVPLFPSFAFSIDRCYVVNADSRLAFQGNLRLQPHVRDACC